MGKKNAAIRAIVYGPETEEGRRELARRAAGVHADLVIQYIQNLDCPSDQKRELLDRVIESAKNSPDRL